MKKIIKIILNELALGRLEQEDKEGAFVGLNPQFFVYKSYTEEAEEFIRKKIFSTIREDFYKNNPSNGEKPYNLVLLTDDELNEIGTKAKQ